MESNNDVGSRLKALLLLEGEPRTAEEFIELYKLKRPKLPDDVWSLLATLLRYFMQKGSWPRLEEISALTAGNAGVELEESLRKAIGIKYVRKELGTSHYMTDLWLGRQPTMHRVKIKDGAEVFAGCAVDGLFAFALTKESGRMKTICPACGERLQIGFERGRIAGWEPKSMVLFVGAQLIGSGNAGNLCCPYENLFGTQEHLENWLSKSPEVGGFLFTRDQALRLATTMGGDPA